jgi:hypothetical protein
MNWSNTDAVAKMSVKTPKPPKPADREANPRYRIPGASEKKVTRSIRELTRAAPASDEMLLITKQIMSLVKESEKDLTPAHDRSAAIVASALTEYLLEITLLRHMKNSEPDAQKNLFAENGPMGSFYAKIHLAYALGIIDKKTRGDLDTIRRIRNAFAHARISVHFDTEEIAAECCKMRSSFFGLDAATVKFVKSLEEDKKPRQMFLWGCVDTIFRVTVVFFHSAIKKNTQFRREIRELLKSEEEKGTLTAADKRTGQRAFKEAGDNIKRVKTLLATFPAMSAGSSKRES